MSTSASQHISVASQQASQQQSHLCSCHFIITISSERQRDLDEDQDHASNPSYEEQHYGYEELESSFGIKGTDIWTKGVEDDLEPIGNEDYPASEEEPVDFC